MPAMYEAIEEDAAGKISEETTTPEDKEAVAAAAYQEINSEKWLYVTLMSVLTVGYVHLMIFIALTIIMTVYFVTRCCVDSQERVGLLSPVKLWLFIDEGIFSLLDEFDEVDPDW